MRIVITADLAGASGVVSREETGRGAGGPNAPDYRQARSWLTGDVNAAVEGAMEAGASSFVLHDGCGLDAQTVLLDELHPAVEVVRGQPLVFYEEADLARGYDGALAIGIHARNGQPGLLSQVLPCPLVHEVRLNGQPVGEAEIAALLAGAYGIPTLLVTGDDRACQDLQRWSGGKVETGIVKYALSRHTARCLPLIESRERIRVAARRAIERRNEVKPVTLPAPVALEIEFAGRDVAHRVAWMPGVSYDGDRSVRFSNGDYKHVHHVLLAALWIAASRLNGE